METPVYPWMKRPNDIPMKSPMKTLLKSPMKSPVESRMKTSVKRLPKTDFQLLVLMISLRTVIAGCSLVGHYSTLGFHWAQT